jgi:hypothetical protein
MYFGLSLAAMVALQVAMQPAWGWLQAHCEDDEVVSRSSLIVVGAIKAGSIVYVRHKDDRGAMSWEYHATLEIGRVLKGKCGEKEIPIAIHYGLTPVSGGRFERDGVQYSHWVPAGLGPESIQIWDTGNSGRPGGPFVQDAGKENIWLLRRRTEMKEDRWPGGDEYGILDPEDVQPMELLDYLVCYTKPDAEGAVRALMQKQPEMADRALCGLMHIEVRRIIAEPDAGRRAERLLPYAFGAMHGVFSWEAQQAIEKAGRVAGPYLLGAFKETDESRARQEIIRMWGRLGYTPCVDLLIDLLQKDDKFWEGQELKFGWWEDDTSPVGRRRLEVLAEIQETVSTLAEVGDPEAAGAIELTRKRWADFEVGGGQIVSECDRALERFGAPATTEPGR